MKFKYLLLYRLILIQFFPIIFFFFGNNFKITGQEVTVYTQDFGDDELPQGWSNVGNGIWIISPDEPSDMSNASGGNNLSIGDSLNPGIIKFSNLPTIIGYTNFKVIWGANREIGYDPVVFSWSTDGNIWNDAVFVDVSDDNNWAWINDISIPASGTPNLQFKWRYNSNGVEGVYRIDDFSIMGCKLPLTSPIVGADEVCQGDTGIIYSTNIPNADEYFWSYSGTGIQSIVNGNKITITYSESAESGTLQVYGHNDCGNGSISEKSITVNPKPIADFTFKGVCFGSLTEFTDQSSGSGSDLESWNWNFGDGYSAAIQNPANEFDSIRIYSVQLIVTTVSGCKDTITKQVTISEQVPVTIVAQANPNPACSNETVTFKTINENAGSNPYYDWYINGDTIDEHDSTFSISTLKNNDKVEVYIYPSADICPENSPVHSEPLIMQIYPSPDTSGIVTKPPTGQAYVLIYPGNPENHLFSYQWYKNNEPLESENNKFYYEEDGIDFNVEYKVTVVNEFDCKTELKYSSTGDKIVLFHKSDIFGIFPNPNNGNFNIILNDDIIPENAETMDVRISDMAGKLKFKTHLSTDDQEISISDMKKGIYLIEVSIESKIRQIRKLIIF